MVLFHVILQPICFSPSHVILYTLQFLFISDFYPWLIYFCMWFFLPRMNLFSHVIFYTWLTYFHFFLTYNPLNLFPCDFYMIQTIHLLSDVIIYMIHLFSNVIFLKQIIIEIFFLHVISPTHNPFISMWLLHDSFFFLHMIHLLSHVILYMIFFFLFFSKWFFSYVIFQAICFIFLHAIFTWFIFTCNSLHTNVFSHLLYFFTWLV